MCTKPARREGAEERPSQVGMLGRDVDRSGDITEAEANRVQVDIEDWVMPTMAEYRLGARPRWRSLHDATFVRRSSSQP